MLERTRRILAPLVSLFILGWASFAFAAPAEGNGFRMPRNIATEGHRIDWLINITNVFIFILFIMMVLWMVGAVVLYRNKPDAEYDHGDSKHHVITACVISAVIFVIVDGNLYVNAMIDLGDVFYNFDKPGAVKDVVKLEINGRQWIWEARYAGPDGQFNTADDPLTTNDVRVPVDTPIMLQLGSPDVIHNFNLPFLRNKVDAVPGTVTQMWFQAKETGEFEIGCAQHCGVNHYKMKGLLTILPKEAFTAWVAQASTDSQQSYDAKDEEAHWGWAWKKI